MFDIAGLESFMYQASNLFLVPVLVIMVILFFYAFFILGGTSAQHYQRRKGHNQFNSLSYSGTKRSLSFARGYPLYARYCGNANHSPEDLEIFAIKSLEMQRIVTRVAPMLGLVATMIPMGPALKALADGNVQGISENLIVAFAAVIFGLITSSITFCTASIKKQWLMAEMRKVQELVSAKTGQCIGSTADALLIEEVVNPEEGHEAA